MMIQNVLKGFLYDGISMSKVSVHESSNKSDDCWQGRATEYYARDRKSSQFEKWTLLFQFLILVISSSSSSSNCSSNTRWSRIAWGTLMPFYPEFVIGKRQKQLAAINCTSYLQQRKFYFSFIYLQNSVLLQSDVIQRSCFNTAVFK